MCVRSDESISISNTLLKQKFELKTYETHIEAQCKGTKFEW
jgi:hypothetical protein